MTRLSSKNKFSASVRIYLNNDRIKTNDINDEIYTYRLLREADIPRILIFVSSETCNCGVTARLYANLYI